MAVATREKSKLPPDVFGRGPHDDFNGGGSDDSDRRPVPSAQIALWLFLIAVTMLFAGMVSAYIISRSGPTWETIPTPRILWLNTAILLLSSGALELGRRALRRLALPALKGWLGLTTLLGGTFLIGQLEAWRQLRNAGVYLPTNPHSSFFYVLTGAHGLHFLGGMVVLAYVLWLARGGAYTRLRRRFNLCAVYWHFLGGLWLYLFWMFLSQ